MSLPKSERAHARPDPVTEMIVASEMRGDETLRAAVELALRVAPGEPLPVTSAVLDAVVPYFAARLERGMESASKLERQRWSDLVAETRRQVKAMHRWQDRRAEGSGSLLEVAAYVAAGSCETYTTGPGSCTTHGVRYAYSPYECDRWCTPCLMWAALEGVPLTRHPAGWCDRCGTRIPEVDSA